MAPSWTLPIAGLLAVACGAGGCGPSGDAADAADAGARGADAAADTSTGTPDDGSAGADTGGSDAAVGDGASADRGPVGYPRPDYQTLSETGLYGDPATLTLATDLMAYEPAHQLWSDAADKRRWLRLPPGTQIDTTDMDHWVFPIGTKVWKEFALGGVLLETRLIERYGPEQTDYYMAAFVWSADGRDATVAPQGAVDVNGTMHDVPLMDQCGACHRGEKGRLLGVSAIQLSHDGTGLTIARLSDQGLLSARPAAGSDYSVPGDAVTAAALGYMHANCGHCHTENATAWHDTQIIMRLGVAERNPQQSALWQSLVGQPLQFWQYAGITQLVVPGDPDTSAVVARMKLRGSKDQMPPIATELTDATGIDRVSAWVSSLR